MNSVVRVVGVNAAATLTYQDGGGSGVKALAIPDRPREWPTTSGVTGVPYIPLIGNQMR